MQKVSLIIIDIVPHNNGGHFSKWHNIVVTKALAHFDNILVYAAPGATPEMTMIPEIDRRRITIYHAHKIWNNKSHLDVFMQLCKHQETFHPNLGKPGVFIMWGEQFLNRCTIFPSKKRMLSKLMSVLVKCPLNRPWGSLYSMGSVVYDDLNHTPNSQEHLFLDVVLRDPFIKGILLWDEYAATRLGEKFIYLPDYEPTSCNFKPYLPDSPLHVGSVGQLWGYRCMNLLAEIYSDEPELYFTASGTIKRHSLSVNCLNLLTSNFPRFKVVDKYLDEDTLNQAIAELDAFVVDSRKYKNPSGLAIRAMACGIPVVSVNSPSWIAAMIKKHGVGVFWRQGEKRLEMDLREWYSNGGRERSRALAKRLSDEIGMSDALKTIFLRLS